MPKVKLCFHNLYSLWSFTQTIPHDNIEINATVCALICECTEQQIELALNKFGAKIELTNFPTNKSLLNGN